MNKIDMNAERDIKPLALIEPPAFPTPSHLTEPPSARPPKTPSSAEALSARPPKSPRSAESHRGRRPKRPRSAEAHSAGRPKRPRSAEAHSSRRPKTPRLQRTNRRKTIPTRRMVETAIKAQTKSRRRGVSLAAIKKYIALNYQDVLANPNSRFKHIKRYILGALENGQIVRTKGTGMTGSFLLSVAMKKQKPPQAIRGKKLKAIREQLNNNNQTNGNNNNELVRMVSITSLQKSIKSKSDLTKK